MEVRVPAEPKIPMKPSDLPRQRLHLVVDLPPRPEPFEFGVGWGDFPEGVVPKTRTPREPLYLAQVEWAETPWNNGIVGFYLQARRKVWLLWTRTLDDNAWPWRWDWLPVAWCPRKGVTERQAAVHLLAEFWRFDRSDCSGSRFDWINEAGDLSVADLMAIARLVKAER